jgi:uncharacterized protein (DUF2461 family)
MGGGLYMPSNAQLHAIRSHIAATHPRLHRLVTTTAFRRTVGALEGERLSRVPRGYAKDHPAAHYLQFKQFLAGREFDAEFATRPAFYRELLATFRAVAPMVRFLNGALPAADATPAPEPPSGAQMRDRSQTAARRQVPAPMW